MESCPGEEKGFATLRVLYLLEYCTLLEYCRRTLITARSSHVFISAVSVLVHVIGMILLNPFQVDSLLLVMDWKTYYARTLSTLAFSWTNHLFNLC